MLKVSIVFLFLQVKEVDLDTAIKCLAQNYKIFKDSGSGLEPVKLSIADRMTGMTKMNERKPGTHRIIIIIIPKHCFLLVVQNSLSLFFNFTFFFR